VVFREHPIHVAEQAAVANAKVRAGRLQESLVDEELVPLHIKTQRHLCRRVELVHAPNDLANIVAAAEVLFGRQQWWAPTMNSAKVKSGCAATCRVFRVGHDGSRNGRARHGPEDSVDKANVTPLAAMLALLSLEHGQELGIGLEGTHAPITGC
jgi:hypothetical protein